MVRSGRSAGLTPAPCAAARPGLASDDTAAADAPRNPRRELVFDIVTSLGSYSLLSAIVIDMRLRVMASRHSAFYSPLLFCLYILRGRSEERRVGKECRSR